MNIAELPEIFYTDYKIQTTKGDYTRHYISCSKKDCSKCHNQDIGHAYWYFYPKENPKDLVFYLGTPKLKRIHLWGKLIKPLPKDFEHIKNLIIHNRG